MLILDTDVVTLLFEDDSAVKRHLEKARQSGESVATTIITWAEIMRGRVEYLLKATDSEQFRKAQRLLRRSEEQLRSVPILLLDERALARFQSLRQTKGIKNIGRADLLIGAIALARNAMVMTRNVKDFGRIPHLTLADWMD